MSAKLISTTDYTKFKLCQFNRNVSKKDALIKSMKQHGFIPAYPIHCVRGDDGLLHIKAGHHRYEVAKQLGIPLFYVISDDDATIHELEKATVKWTVSDYLESFARSGNEHYIELKQYHEFTGIPLSMCVSLLGGESAASSNMLHKFKDGTFTVRGREHAEDVKDVVLFCRKLGVHVGSHFVAAISRCLMVPEFSLDQFKARAAANSHMLRIARTTQDQMKILEDVYNHRSVKGTIPLCFLADQIMKKRSCVGKGKASS